VYILASRKQGTLYIGDVRDAILREKRLKKWRWDWKIGFIEESNPEWGDLYLGLTQ
jgi:predicted GIY-YIG superfamily endonuclease